MVVGKLPLISWPKTSLLAVRSSADVYVKVHRAAVHLFALGYPEYANQLIACAYEYGHGLDFDHYDRDVCLPLYEAWDITGTLPGYIRNPDQDKVLAGIGPKSESDEYWPRWQKDWTDGLPKSLKEKALRGDLEAADVEHAMKLMDKERAKDLPEKSLSIGAMIQVAMLADKEDIARRLVEEEVASIYLSIQDEWDNPNTSERNLTERLRIQLALHHSPKIWHILKDAELGKALGVDEKALLDFVNEGRSLIEQRFTQGPARPYTDKSIPELVRLLDENYIAARKAYPESGINMSVLNIKTWPNSPTTFLAPGASSSDVSELKAKLAGEANRAGNTRDLPICLPDDYENFLRITNGFQMQSLDSCGLFYATDTISYCPSNFDEIEYTLFPLEFTSGIDLDHISIADCVSYDIGAGGDEGNVLIVPAPAVKPVLAAFEEAYAAASVTQKLIYERAARDLFGGIEELRRVEELMVVSYHWDTAEHIWGSFKKYLEHCVEKAVRMRAEAERKQEKKAKA